MDKYTKTLLLLSVYVFYLVINSIAPSVVWFSIFLLVAFCISKPVFLLSPKTIVFSYYFLWFGVSPIFAERYQSLSFDDNTLFLAYALLATSYVILIVTCDIFIIEENYVNLSVSKIAGVTYNQIFTFSALTLFFLILYVQTTGGVGYWLQNLDRAFLTRQGAGLYYLGFSLSLPITLFLLGVKVRSVWLLLFISVLVLMLSPLIGSKQKIIVMFLVLFVTRFFLSKLNSNNMIIFLIPVTFLFILGNYFRNSSWMEWSDVLSYSLNYFDTLDSLLIVLRDFDGFDLMTFFLPFNKLYNLLNNTDEFFDLSAYLTSIYFPDAWAIRATVQFPIEVDLYLSFGFWLGLPFLFLFFISFCLVFKKSLTSKSAIMIYIWFYLFVYLISHLRGGVFLWTDMYVYPYLLLVYFLFRKRLTYVC